MHIIEFNVDLTFYVLTPPNNFTEDTITTELNILSKLDQNVTENFHKLKIKLSSRNALWQQWEGVDIFTMGHQKHFYYSTGTKIR